MKVRFSGSFLASHRINQRDRMQKYTCCYWHVWCGVQVLTSTCRVFWLSGHLFLAMQFISEFIWVNVRWNGPIWQSQNHNCVRRHWKETYFARARDRNTARANQSASQDCRLATNQRLKNPDLRHRLKKKRAHFKTRPPAFGLGRVKMALLRMPQDNALIHSYCVDFYTL